ncbi:hypothetical protein [Weissella cibaria]|nr:hypothetical protein [Weissella cibaria]
MANRLFVLAPLREVATPERVEIVTDLIAATTDTKQVMRIGEFEDHANE